VTGPPEQRLVPYPTLPYTLAAPRQQRLVLRARQRPVSARRPRRRPARHPRRRAHPPPLVFCRQAWGGAARAAPAHHAAFRGRKGPEPPALDVCWLGSRLQPSPVSVARPTAHAGARAGAPPRCSASPTAAQTPWVQGARGRQRAPRAWLLNSSTQPSTSSSYFSRPASCSAAYCFPSRMHSCGRGARVRPRHGEQRRSAADRTRGRSHSSSPVQGCACERPQMADTRCSL